MLFGFLYGPAAAQIVGTLPFQLQNGTTADATQVMADFNKILNDVNINGAKNGVNTDITALNALVTPLTPAQGGSTIYFASTSGGSANAQTVATPVPVGFTLSVGKRITFLAGFTNTGAMTLNVNATGATAVLRQTPAGPVALLGGEVVANNYVEAVFDGTQFQLYTDASQQGGFGALTTLASATTTDLGTIAGHNVSISGTTTITSFGSSALVGLPNYKIRFVGALTLTYNATSLILPGAASITTAANDNAEVQYLGSGNWIVTSYTKANGSAIAGVVPTIQTFTSGSGTYNRPANVRYLHIRMVGAGGGGGGSGNAAGVGGTGGNTTFSTFTANGGAGGGGGATGANTGGAGGTSTGCAINLTGQTGSATVSNSGATNLGGTGGGSAFFGGGGLPSSAGVNNTGGGGVGGAFSATSAGGGGGGGSGSCEGWINTPAATYSYAVGASGSVGSAGTSGNAGTLGGTGFIIVEEYY